MRFVCLFAVFCMGVIAAEEPEGLAPFKVDSVIDASIANLKPPRWYPEVVSWKPAIMASSEQVQKHVRQGLALIHAGWDFEAYRHFVEAVKEDPNCLMAYWGISLALANPNSEITEERFAAIERMLDLVKNGAGNQVERGQAEALAYLFSEQPERAPEVFDAIAYEFPNNLQVALMAAFMKRDGYDSLLGAGPGQKQALREVRDIFAKNPDSQMALSFWIALHAEHPDGLAVLRKEVLPRVRNLVKFAPDFPPYRELLGHFEWRSGNLLLAKGEFEKAIELYRVYLKEEGLGYEDCQSLIRAQIYLATVHKSLGDMEGALAIARELQTLDLNEERLTSPGTTLLLWEGKTLGARLFLARGNKGDFEAGLKELPRQAVGEAIALKTPAVMAWECWRQALSARDAIEKKKYKEVPGYLDGLVASDNLLESAGKVVRAGSGRQEWVRTRQALKVEWMLGKAVYTGQGADAAERGRASFWIQSAVDEREPAKGISPPIFLSSPWEYYARFYAQEGQQENAQEAYTALMKECLNDVQVLEDYAGWLESQKNQEKAKSIRDHIKVVTGEKG